MKGKSSPPFLPLVPELSLSVLAVLMLAGCLAPGIPDSDDPQRLIGIAYEAMDMGRSAPAERALNKALRLYQQQGDRAGMADVHFGLGNLFKNTQVAPSRLHLDVAKQEFEEALRLYQALGYKRQMAKAYFAQGELAQADKDHAAACALWKRSGSSYAEGRAAAVPGDQEITVLNPHYRDFPALLVATQVDSGCLAGVPVPKSQP